VGAPVDEAAHSAEVKVLFEMNIVVMSWEGQ
jgi:hypothetical protein